MIEWLIEIQWQTLIFICLTLGLAPFAPPHIVEKLIMLRKRKLKKLLDWFDLVLHGTPWVILIIKGLAHSFLLLG